MLTRNSFEAEYRPLRQADYDAFVETAESSLDFPENKDYQKWLPWRRVVFWSLILVQFGVDMVFVFLVWKIASHGPPSSRIFYSRPHLYSPAQEAIEYGLKVFDRSAANGKTAYQQPPSPAVDTLWEDLYQFGISQVPKSEAALLPNKTAPIPGNEDYYVVELQLFHELHCLNYLRITQWPEHYSAHLAEQGLTTEEEIRNHNMHCIDTLRQSVMCTADITPIVWQWEEDLQITASTYAVSHMCRNYDRVRDWAKEHEMQSHFDNFVHVEDDIVIPVLY